MAGGGRRIIRLHDSERGLHYLEGCTVETGIRSKLAFSWPSSVQALPPCVEFLPSVQALRDAMQSVSAPKLSLRGHPSDGADFSDPDLRKPRR